MAWTLKTEERDLHHDKDKGLRACCWFRDGGDPSSRKAGSLGEPRNPVPSPQDSQQGTQVCP